MSAFAAGTGNAPVVRVIQPRSRRARNPRPDGYLTAYVEPRIFIPASTADLWNAARPRWSR
jgi:hypothetical protein